MRRLFIILILTGFAVCAGCTDYYKNYTTPRQNLPLDHSAVFEKDDIAFMATIDGVKISRTTGGPHAITIHLTVKNTGKKAVSLVAYPKVTDGSGREYPGKNIFLGAMNLGGKSSGESIITIPSDEDFAELEKQAVLNIKFQSAQPNPWEGAWNLDIDTLK